MPGSIHGMSLLLSFQLFAVDVISIVVCVAFIILRYALEKEDQVGEKIAVH